MTADLFEQLQAGLGDRYVIERELAPGGMSRLYVAVSRADGNRVVIKTLPPELASEVNAARFEREIDVTSRLHHPRILPVTAAGRAGGILFYVMPYADGETLRSRLAREKQLPIEDAVRISTQVAEALAYAHGQGVIHRDIKPDNIYLSGEGAVVADFGIARAVTRSAGESITSTGVAIGTPAYMSPEQAGGDGAADSRSDLYSLACVTYEMIAGLPPFVGATTEAVIAQRFAHRPPELSRHRRAVPPHVEATVRRALELAPADRFATADEFAAALSDRGGVSSRAARRAERRMARYVIALAAAAIVLGVGVYDWLRAPLLRYGKPDSSRVVVFPLTTLGGDANTDAGRGVATMIGYALEGTAPLKWLDGEDWMGRMGMVSERQISVAEKRRVSLAAHAAHFIDGSIFKDGDSDRVVLRLYDAAGDSIIGRSGASARSGESAAPALGLRAIATLLVPLLAAGRAVDVSALIAIRPAAIANFLQGERAYRTAHFVEALSHYQAAVKEDSLFALAAMRGAEAASWQFPPQRSEAERLTTLAMRSYPKLPLRYAEFAQGSAAFYAGMADSAAAHYRRALATDSQWPEAWVALASVYEELLPLASAPESIARGALERARTIDSGFAVPLYGLTRIALHRRAIEEASANAALYLRANPDSSFNRRVRLLVQCARDGPATIPWSELARNDAAEVILVAKNLSEAAAYPACAGAAARALLREPGVPLADRWGALLVLNAVLVAGNDTASIAQLLTSPEVAGLPADLLLPLDAAAGASVEVQAADAVRHKGTNYAMMNAPTLWLLGTWEASRGGAVPLGSISIALKAKRDSTRSRRDSLLFAAISARAAEAVGDTDLAIERLARLSPTGNDAELEWQPWEPLAAERLSLVRLLLARNDPTRAETFASTLDSPRPNANLLFLRAVLQLRIEAARRTHDDAFAARLTQRLNQLSGDSSATRAR